MVFIYFKWIFIKSFNMTNNIFLVVICLFCIIIAKYKKIHIKMVRKNKWTTTVFSDD